MEYESLLALLPKAISNEVNSIQPLAGLNESVVQINNK